MVNVQEVVVSVCSGYGLIALGFLLKSGIGLVKQKLGEKKFNRIAKDCRIAVAALWDINEELGLDKLEKAAVKQVLGKKKYKDAQIIEETVKKVISSMDSMVDNPLKTKEDGANVEAETEAIKEVKAT